ncbi:MAG TPA: hypothetical protein VF837_02310 [Patescibacteria group bacterium]
MPNLDSLEKLLNNKITVGLSVGALLILAAANLVGTNALATQGYTVANMETKTLALEKENRDLQVKIEESTQLQALQNNAQSNGYVMDHDIVFMPTPPATAMR